MSFRSARVWLDATQTVIDGISDEWAGTVVPAVPTDRPDEFVVVQRVGGSNDGVLDTASIDVECWSGEPNASQVPAWTLAGTIREIVRMLPDTVAGICDVEEDTASFLPDELSDTPRVLLTFTVLLKPSAGTS